MTPEQIEYLKTLAPPPAGWGGLGATPLSTDPRDYDIRLLPGVADALAAGVPNSVDLTGFIRGEILNQGATGACVAFSTAHLCAIDEVIRGDPWPNLNAPLIYSRAGGTGSNGVDTRLVLSQAVDSGVPLVTGGSINVLQSYAFVPQQAGVFTDALKAALATGYPCVLALLLPTDFGWRSGSGAVSQGYHQICLIGYTADGYWLFVNSWGASWPGNSPHAGVGSILQSYIETNNFQQRYAYSYTVTAARVEPPPPPPPPPPPVHTRATVTGSATGQVDTLMRGTVYSLGSCSVTLSQIDFDQNPPPPPPPPPGLSVTGYSPNPVKGGDNFYIQGQGFQGGNLSVLWQDRLLSANRLSDAQIQATAPSVTTTASGPVTVRVEGVTADGPALTVSADEGPPPADLKVTVTARRYSRGLVGIWAYVQAPGSGALDIVMPPTDDIILPPTVLNPEIGGYVAATVQGTVGMMALAARQTTTTGLPAVWQLASVPAMATITITAVDDQGRRGQGTAGV